MNKQFCGEGNSTLLDALRPRGTSHLTFYIHMSYSRFDILAFVHVRVMRFETLLACRGENPLSGYKSCGPGGPCQSPDTGLTAIVKKSEPRSIFTVETVKPLLFLSRSPSADDKWPQWYIRQDQINCAIKRSRSQ